MGSVSIIDPWSVTDYYMNHINTPYTLGSYHAIKDLGAAHAVVHMFVSPGISQDGHSSKIDAEDNCGRYKSASRSSELKQNAKGKR